MTNQKMSAWQFTWSVMRHAITPLLLATFVPFGIIAFVVCAVVHDFTGQWHALPVIAIVFLIRFLGSFFDMVLGFDRAEILLLAQEDYAKGNETGLRWGLRAWLPSMTLMECRNLLGGLRNPVTRRAFFAELARYGLVPNGARVENPADFNPEEPL